MTKMLYNKLGLTDVEVSAICLGTMTWGEQNTEEEAWEQLDYFLECGGNFIDTAELYPVPPSPTTCGRTEEYIGRWMAARGSRDKVFLATKVMGGGGDTRNFIPANRTVPIDPDAPNGRLERDQIFAAIAGSLRRLQTTYIDLYQLHWPDRYAPAWGKNQFSNTAAAGHVPVSFEEQVQAIGDLIKAGKVRHWGVSNETPYGVVMMTETAKKLGVPLPVTIQNDFSLLDRRFEGHLAEACYHSGNVGLLVYGGLAGGTLSNKFHDGSIPSANSRHVKFPKFQPRYHCDRALEAAGKYYKLAQSKNLSLQQLAYAWCKSRFYVCSTIIGSTTISQLKENIAAFTDIELDEETLAAIDSIHMERRNPNVTD
ncbi:hypothetical protein Ndes2437B_g08008 [Nannochloris sp. 'desiccata']